MNRTLISRQELQVEALAALRCEPDCAGIKSLSLTVVAIVNDGSTDWHLEVIDPGEVSPEIAYRAADRVKDALAHQYELRDP
jgi:hypothetical protein